MDTPKSIRSYSGAEELRPTLRRKLYTEIENSPRKTVRIDDSITVISIDESQPLISGDSLSDVQPLYNHCDIPSELELRDFTECKTDVKVISFQHDHHPTKNATIESKQHLLVKKKLEKTINNNTIETRPLESYSPDTDTESLPPPVVIVWKPKRSQSIESRDNPFIPGGELSREAEALLQSSTIIRDRFYINENDGSLSDPNSPQTQGMGDNCVVEETVLAESAKSTHAAPKPRENGKIEDSTSPECVKVEIPVSQSSPQKDGLLVSDEHIKDKKKKNKCCSVM